MTKLVQIKKIEITSAITSHTRPRTPGDATIAEK